MLCFTRKVAGGRREKGRAEETNSLSAKTLRLLRKESYTSVISFRHQITFFKLIGSDRQNISSEFIQRHPFTAPQNVFWATTDKTFSKSVQIQSFPVKVFSLLLFTTDGMKAFPLSAMRIRETGSSWALWLGCRDLSGIYPTEDREQRLSATQWPFS